MAKYVLCEECKKLIEYKPKVKLEYGNTITTIECPECGHKKVTTQVTVSPMFLEGRK